ncbi:MAG: hypothetical protein Gaeavirus24_3 [Gaeavirus sp.]|uniref:Uncharacterized protein n=1 Tax=Gaeavirus sp. TaxID=2487767 RepID=A0A3G4ZZC1_9VIRU|nr:MAG: hypothetical protein Gaeavirus24_3 [Gaeavirus sp.]
MPKQSCALQPFPIKPTYSVQILPYNPLPRPAVYKLIKPNKVCK